jgi:hypothetical protein
MTHTQIEIERLLAENRQLKTMLEASEASCQLWMSAYQQQSKKLSDALSEIDGVIEILGRSKQ